MNLSKVFDTKGLLAKAENDLNGNDDKRHQREIAAAMTGLAQAT
jgi:hypothetical protein